MSKKAKELAARYGRKSDVIDMVQDIIGEQEKINAFKHPLCAIVTQDEEIQTSSWGLIPSTGFYEWRHEDKNKIPYFISSTL